MPSGRPSGVRTRRPFLILPIGLALSIVHGVPVTVTGMLRELSLAATVTADYDLPAQVPSPWSDWDAIAFGGDRHQVSGQHPGAISACTMKGRLLTSSLTLSAGSAPLRPVSDPAQNSLISTPLLRFDDQTGVADVAKLLLPGTLSGRMCP